MTDVCQDAHTGKEEKSATHVNVKVTAQDGATVHFKIKKQTPLRKLMHAYCDRQSIKVSSVRFMFDGNHIQEMDTPEDIGLEDDETIEVFLQQTGGFV
ncbi:small ubiquitin-related modifier 2-A-like [Lineus longissimus]|uniref:small ubiquitin-related modifier 2-A-like n=1 Tax=Lineus longissimus TaxID=88925 RepID=UPI002B4F35B2